ncbi:protein phosphatase inhibitor [Malassezia pachydermatis]
MNPHQQNKVDISSLSEQEQKLFRLYGKLPNKKDLLANKLKERKYFDSGDYALSKAGRAPKQSVGTTIPNPEMVPHAAANTGGVSPVQIPNANGNQSLGVNIPGATPTSPSQTGRSSFVGSFSETGSRSSFPMATGVLASSPGRDTTSSLSREQVPDLSSSHMEE